MTGGDDAGSPGGLEVEAAGGAVDVKDFAGEMKAGEVARFEGGEVYGVQGHAAAGDEFVAESGLTLDTVFIGSEDGLQTGGALAPELAPADIAAQPGAAQ